MCSSNIFIHSGLNKNVSHASYGIILDTYLFISVNIVYFPMNMTLSFHILLSIQHMVLIMLPVFFYLNLLIAGFTNHPLLYTILYTQTTRARRHKDRQSNLSLLWSRLLPVDFYFLHQPRTGSHHHEHKPPDGSLIIAILRMQQVHLFPFKQPQSAFFDAYLTHHRMRSVGRMMFLLFII